jgi:H+/Cl- antiporter ClcA
MRPAGCLTDLSRLMAEQGTLFASLVKWTALAAATGALVGVSTTLFLWSLDATLGLAARVPWPLVLLPLGFLAASALVRALAPDAQGHGTEKVIEAVHRRWGRISAKVAPVKLAATVLTIAVGGSVGKEGPCAQIGAALASSVASLLRLRPRDRRKIVICGISAGFATVFGTPIAGSIFGIEVLYLGSVLYDVLYPSFVAGIVGFEVSTWLGVSYMHQRIATVPTASQGLFLQIVGAGLVFGLIALFLIEALNLADRVLARVPWPRPIVALAGGVTLAVLASLTSTRYLGLGVPTIEEALQGVRVPLDAFFWKIIFTSISLAAGGSGGIVTPIFFIGATGGSALGAALGLDRGIFAELGMVALLAAAANAPLSASIMALELFGTAVGPMAAIASIVAFTIVGHRGVYPSQVLAITKTPSIRAPRGVDLAGLGPIVVRPSGVRRLRVRWRAVRRTLERRRRDIPPPAA